MITFDQILPKIHEIKNLGFVKTHRSGDTGIGKTLEDLLGIEENNIPFSNGYLIEMVVAAILLFLGAGYTLFTPLWWVGVIMGIFAGLLSLGVLDRIVSGSY